MTANRQYIKRLLASLLLGAMVICSTVAFAADNETANITLTDTASDSADPELPDDIPDGLPVYDGLYYESIGQYIFGDSVYYTHMPAGWAKKCDDSKTKVITVRVKATSKEMYISWKEKSKAVSYEIQLSRTSGFKKSEYMFATGMDGYASYTQLAETSYIYRPSERKTYYVRVRAVYASGQPGPWSKAVKFTPDGKFHK